MLGLFLNTLAADEMYPLLKRDNLTVPIQLQLSQKQKTFSLFFPAFFRYRFNSQYFGNNDDPHRFCNFEIPTSENVVRWMSKNSCFRTPFHRQHCKRAEALLKSASQHLYHNRWSLPSQFSWKKSRFLTCQILGLLVKTLAADEKYPLLKRDNLTIPIHMQLSLIEKTFSPFFAAFLKSRWNFEHFDKKDALIDFVIFKLRTPKT